MMGLSFVLLYIVPVGGSWLSLQLELSVRLLDCAEVTRLTAGH